MLGKYNKNDGVKSDLKREKDLLKKEQDKKELILPATALEGNARCVPVGTILIAPDGCNKKEMFTGKSPN